MQLSLSDMQTSSLKHYFLIATPSLKDANFAKAVVYLHEHNKEGAMGLIINKPLHITLGNVLRHLDIQIDWQQAEDKPVLMGGPVGQEHGFVIHNNLQPRQNDDDDPIVISSSKDVLRDIAVGRGPDDFLVTLGYAGWQPGQLEQELGHNDWLVAPFNPKVLFAVPINQRWQAAAKLIGLDITRLSDHVGHA